MTRAPQKANLLPADLKSEVALTHLIHAIQPYIHQYGYFAVFFAIFLEDFGVPMPGETMLIAASLGASQGSLNIFLVGLIAWGAAVLGDNTGYAIGRFGGRRLVLALGKYVLITHKRLDYAEGFFRRRGPVVVIIARFVEILRQLNGIIAGVVEMHWLKFLLFNSIGAALWVGLWSTLFYVLGSQADTLGDLFRKFEFIFFAVIVIGFVAWLAIHTCKRRREREMAELSNNESS